MKKANKKLILSIANMVLAFVAFSVFSVYFVYAWFVLEKGKSPTAEIDTFKVTLTPSFTGTGNTDITNSSLIDISLNTAAQKDKLTDFRLSVSFTGKTDACLRVRVSCIWTQTIGSTVTYPRLDAVKFASNSDSFIDNSKVDSYYYYSSKGAAGALDDYILKGDGTTKTFNIITGVPDPKVYESNVSLKLYVLAEIVQANRFKEKWAITSYPTRPAL